MRHPNKDTIYCLSYPRSGSNWFLYCFAFITETDMGNNEGLLYHSHSCNNVAWTLENTFDIKNILLMRNYKEAIFSEWKNLFSKEKNREPGHEFASRSDYVLDLFLSTILQHVAEFSPTIEQWREKERPDWIGLSHKEIYAVTRRECVNLNIEELFSEFLLSDMPTSLDFKVDTKSLAGIERIMTSSYIFHFHFALQLKRYYDLLKYHDKVSRVNSDNALLIEYEDMVLNPIQELNRVIDFIEKSDLVGFESLQRMKDNINKLNDNLEYHKGVSIDRYRNTGHLGSSYNKSQINIGEFYSRLFKCRDEFLMKIDNVLKNKDLELFNKYLSDYEKRDEQ